jgi:hypothetical protein
MAAKLVKVDSGIDPLTRLEFVPEKRWPELVDARSGYISFEFTRDCRKLVEWVRDAEKLWFPLGYADADDLITRGYGLEPEEIRLAARWLELNVPDEAIGLQEVVNKAQQLAADPAVKPAPAHGEIGRGRNRDDNVNSNQGGNSASYLVRRLKRDAPEIAPAQGRGEYPSARAAGIAAGIVKVPTPLEQVKRAIARLSPAERRQLRRWLDAGGD